MVVTRTKGRSAVHWRAPGAQGWKQLAEFDVFEAPFVPRFVDGAGVLYVTTDDGADGTEVLKRFDFATGAPEARAMVSAPGYDFRGRLIIENPDEKALGVRLTTDAETTVWFHPRMAALQEEVDKRWPDRIHRLSCARCGTDEMTALVYSFNDRDPGQYWVRDRASGQWRKVGDRRRDILPQQMAPTSFERIKARVDFARRMEASLARHLAP